MSEKTISEPIGGLMLIAGFIIVGISGVLGMWYGFWELYHIAENAGPVKTVASAIVFGCVLVVVGDYLSAGA